MEKIAFIMACVLAFFAPFVVTKERSAETVNSTFKSFPKEFEGRELQELELSQRERFFLEDFPGQIGRFTDGNREIVIRRVTEATRKLHPASDCFEGVGYTTFPLPIRIDESNKRWSCFSAVKKDERIRVCERIEDNHGGEWTDASSWYWTAWGQGNSEWWAFTVAQSD